MGRSYYNLHLMGRSPAGNGMLSSPVADLAHFSGLEDKFCKDFSCCGHQLSDLHELLQHFEENHVRLESDMDEDEEDDLPFEFEYMDESDFTFDISVTIPNYRNKDIPTLPAVPLSDIYTKDSVFDTSIIRKRTPNSKNRKIPMDTHPLVIPPRFDGPTMVIDMEMDEEGHYVEKTPTKNDRVDRPDRPFKCKFEHCHKSYKNPGGLKYHYIHGHAEITGEQSDGSAVHRPFSCTIVECQKSYKNMNGLKVFLANGSIIWSMLMALFGVLKSFESIL